MTEYNDALIRLRPFSSGSSNIGHSFIAWMIASIRPRPIIRENTGSSPNETHLHLNSIRPRPCSRGNWLKRWRLKSEFPVLQFGHDISAARSYYFPKVDSY